MPFQNHAAVALTASAFLSFLILLWTNWCCERTIQLHGNEGNEENSDNNITYDALDVISPEDLVDGYLVDEDAFWLEMRRRKGLLALLLVLITAFNVGELSYSLADGSALKGELTTSVLQLIFSLYLAALACGSVRKDEANAHSSSILHLTTLSTIATVLFVATTIIPSTPFPHSEAPSVSLASFILSETTGICYTTTALYILTSLIALRTPLGPPLHFPPSKLYPKSSNVPESPSTIENVSRINNGSPWDILMFSYTSKVVWLGQRPQGKTLEISDLPLVPADLRAAFNYSQIRYAIRTSKLNIYSWAPKQGSGVTLMYKLLRSNRPIVGAVLLLSLMSAGLFYLPALALRGFILYLENDPERKKMEWGWFYVAVMFSSSAVCFLVTGQLFSLATSTMRMRLNIQLNTLLYSKTLARRDVVSPPPKPTPSTPPSGTQPDSDPPKPDPDSGSETEDPSSTSTSQVMTLMTIDAERISSIGFHLFSIVSSPIEIVVGTTILYQFLGVSCFFGLAVIVFSMPLNHYAGTTFVGVQEKLLKSRDDRIALMNEVLGAIRMIKYMAAEKVFQKRVFDIRKRELKYQKRQFTVETLWSAIWSTSPILVTLVAFWHYAVYRNQPLTPSTAFTSIMIFNEMKFSLNALPQTFTAVLRTLVSLQRIEKYLDAEEVEPVAYGNTQHEGPITLESCTISWPQHHPIDPPPESSASDANSDSQQQQQQRFQLTDLSLRFPRGKLSLICGKTGSGKTLLLQALLGEASVQSGKLVCPRSAPDSIARHQKVQDGENWVVDGLCAYAPQTAWLQNMSVRDNILFNLPYDEERYRKTLQACALVSDLVILDDGDDTEVGERGTTLSGGQKARVSLARAIYSRASTLFLDDILSAVDAHTARHLYDRCLTGELTRGRTIILVSHHIQLCSWDAAYIVVLDNGTLAFEGDNAAFQSTHLARGLENTSATAEDQEPLEAEPTVPGPHGPGVAEVEDPCDPDAPRAVKVGKKLIEDEARFEGRIKRDVWTTFIWACGTRWYWSLFIVTFLVASAAPVLENNWLRYWSAAALDTERRQNASFYITVYAAIVGAGLVISTIRWLVLYEGSVRASGVLHQKLLDAVLFAPIRFHDTVSRGRLLNRFGKDFEGIDSGLADSLGQTTICVLSALTTIVTISVVGGAPFIIVISVLAVVYLNVARLYGSIARDLRRLDSTSHSPVYAMYGDTIAGVSVIRAFGASSQALRDMLRCIDLQSNPYYWTWGVIRWMSIRFNLLSSAIVGAAGMACLISPSIDAPLAGFTLVFASSITNDLMSMVHQFIGLEQSMVALERTKEYSELPSESTHIEGPPPTTSWPSNGYIQCEGLTVRYAPDLPDVLHSVNFEIQPGEKVAVIGRTGSGKSTLALSMLRIVEPTSGRILIDGKDISQLGLADLRSRLTVIPQDPTIMSGTVRSVVDVFGEHEDAEIYAALQQVQISPPRSLVGDSEPAVSIDADKLSNLDYCVAEGGNNFSMGEKQLLCMARASLRKSKIVIMDEATASVDHATDEVIGKTIRETFSESTVISIAHRLRTIIDYDRVILLDQGCIVEYDRPLSLLEKTDSKFYSMCKAAGIEKEFNFNVPHPGDRQPQS